MSLDDDIRQAIDANLTAEVGARLKERLEQAENDAESLAVARETLKLNDEALATLQKRVTTEHQLDDREDEIYKREHAMEIREAKQEILEEWATSTRNYMIEVLGIVFKGPGQRLAFDLNGFLSGWVNAQGMSQSPSANLSGKIETDGE